MTAPRIVVDGLWRCLCPSIDSIASAHLVKSRSSLASIPRRPRPRLRNNAARSSSYQQIRTVTGDVARWNETVGAVNTSEGQSPEADQVTTRFKLDQAISRSSNKQLHDKLRESRALPSHYHRVAAIVDFLIREKGDPPTTLHYDVLIRANADPVNGSVETVKTLLQEMHEMSITPDAALYNSVLHVLAVHPDYIFRNQILKEMKERWFTLTFDDMHCVVLGLLRERQYELAMDKLEEMQRAGMHIRPYLYDIFTYLLCETGYLDEILVMFQYRVENTREPISPNVWYYALDTFSRKYYYEGIRYIWNQCVESEKILPSDGMCLNILNTAARYHDPGLATKVIRLLTQRGVKLDAHHYEALLDTYEDSHNVSDLTTCFRILCIMKRAGLEPDESTICSLVKTLSSSRFLANKAFSILEKLKEEGQNIPTAAFNALLRGCSLVSNLRSEPAQFEGDSGRADPNNHGFPDPLELYKKLHEVCSAGPNTETFNILLQYVSKRPGPKAHAMFIASEMYELKMKPNQLTYDRLVICCLQRREDVGDALLYMEEMMDSGFIPRSMTLRMLARTLVMKGDEEENVRRVLDLYMEHGTESEPGKKKFRDWCLRELGKERELSSGPTQVEGAIEGW